MKKWFPDRDWVLYEVEMDLVEYTRASDDSLEPTTLPNLRETSFENVTNGM